MRMPLLMLRKGVSTVSNMKHSAFLTKLLSYPVPTLLTGLCLYVRSVLSSVSRRSALCVRCGPDPSSVAFTSMECGHLSLHVLDGDLVLKHGHQLDYMARDSY